MSLMNRLIMLATILTVSYACALFGLAIILQSYLQLSAWFGLGLIVLGAGLYIYQYQAMRR